LLGVYFAAIKEFVFKQNLNQNMPERRKRYFLKLWKSQKVVCSAPKLRLASDSCYYRLLAIILVPRL